MQKNNKIFKNMYKFEIKNDKLLIHYKYNKKEEFPLSEELVNNCYKYIGDILEEKNEEINKEKQKQRKCIKQILIYISMFIAVAAILALGISYLPTLFIKTGLSLISLVVEFSLAFLSVLIYSQYTHAKEQVTKIEDNEYYKLMEDFYNNQSEFEKIYSILKNKKNTENKELNKKTPVTKKEKEYNDELEKTAIEIVKEMEELNRAYLNKGFERVHK